MMRAKTGAIAKSAWPRTTETRFLASTSSLMSICTRVGALCEDLTKKFLVLREDLLERKLTETRGPGDSGGFHDEVFGADEQPVE